MGATLNLVSSFYYVGDESNQLAPIPGYTVVNLHTTYRPLPHFEVFASINNLFNRKYATWGILERSDGHRRPGHSAQRRDERPRGRQSIPEPGRAIRGIRRRADQFLTREVAQSHAQRPPNVQVAGYILAAAAVFKLAGVVIVSRPTT